MRGSSNQIRIIAGRWRGRKLAFPDGQGLRPTSDRIRETLFNWLAPVIPGAHCLDLFAGSGALGFEAASRGAARVVMVEQNPLAAAKLQENRQRFGASALEIQHQAAELYLASTRDSFDIVFLDPPFDAPQLCARVVALLASSSCLKPGGYAYLETPKRLPPPPVPDSWEAVRQKSAGQVAYRLYRHQVDVPG